MGRGNAMFYHKLHRLVEITIAVCLPTVVSGVDLLYKMRLFPSKPRIFPYPTAIVNKVAEVHDALPHSHCFPVPTAGTDHTPSVQRLDTIAHGPHRCIMVVTGTLQNFE